MPLDDRVLLERALAGDGLAFVELYQRYELLTWRLARAVTFSDEDATAAVVDAFARLGSLTGATAVSVRARLAAAARDAGLGRVRRRRGCVRPGPEAIAVAGSRVLDTDDLLAQLPHLVPPPPAELWALVHVAWDHGRQRPVEETI